MLPQLGVYWLVELTLNIIRDPPRLARCRSLFGSVKLIAKLSFSKLATVLAVKSDKMPDLWETALSAVEEDQIQIQLDDPVGPAVAKMSIRLEERIRDLEQTLQEERRGLAKSGRRYAELERKYQNLLRRNLS